MGFAESCSGAAIGYWTGDGEDLPFYYDMASRFPIGDRYFCSVVAQTYPNRRFLIAATALGDIATNASGISQKDAPNGTIFDRLNDAGVSWKDYFPDLPTAALFFPVFENNPSRMVHFSQFFVDAESGNLPAVSLVDPYWNSSEETNDISIGEAYAAEIINAVLRSPNRHNTALFWVYDEHGGWYDHVAPLPAIKPARSHRHSRLATSLAPTTTRASASLAASSRPGRGRTMSRTRCSTTPRSSGSSRRSGTCRR
jgi:phospholipase C